MQARIAQLKAIRHAGLSRPDDLSLITQPVFVANGDHDLMVDSSHSADMARRLPNAKLKIYPNWATAECSSTTKPSYPTRCNSSPEISFRHHQENVMNTDQNQHDDALRRTRMHRRALSPQRV